ncbi:methyltransferase family protein [Ensifer sp. MJa1]|uniref:methyltransferase family protein n=1 Tax=Ensifer sp. MJa1 TaxID=2919888 RepID=UPI00300B21AD
MSGTDGDVQDRSGAIVRPPIAWLAAVGGGLLLDGAYPLPFLGGATAGRLVGVCIFLAGLALLLWAATTFRRAGTEIQTTQPTTAIVETGPYRFTRNPIYIGMFLGLIGLALAFDSVWLVILLVPFYLVIRYGVVAREEAYLERKFESRYLAYKARVRRWL